MHGKFPKVVHNSKEVKNYCSKIVPMISYTFIIPHNFYSHRVSFTELDDSIFTPALLTPDRRNIFIKLISFLALKCHWDIYHYVIRCLFTKIHGEQFLDSALGRVVH